MVLLISLLYYTTMPRHVYYHMLFRDLYFLPLMLAAFWFGLGAALLTSGLITVLYLPFLVIHWQGFSQVDFSRILEILVVNVVAVVLGYISSREKAHQKALRESEGLAAMGKTLSAVAHDMKSPLTAIGGLARLVHNNLDRDDQTRQKLAVVIKETDRLDALVRDMLDFSRPLKVYLAQGDLNELLRESLVIVESQAKERNITVETDLSADLPRAEFDDVRMKQVLINLIVNALQASPQGEKVLVRTYRVDNTICLEVADHGPGVPEEHRGKIFLPFFSTKREGTGLGLPIAVKVLSAHGGTLEVLETGEAGATFRMSLPLARS